jgi:hypothetical protein
MKLAGIRAGGDEGRRFVFVGEITGSVAETRIDVWRARLQCDNPASLPTCAVDQTSSKARL